MTTQSSGAKYLSRNLSFYAKDLKSLSSTLSFQHWIAKFYAAATKLGFWYRKLNLVRTKVP